MRQSGPKGFAMFNSTQLQLRQTPTFAMYCFVMFHLAMWKKMLRCSPWSATFLKRRGSAKGSAKGSALRLWRSFYLPKISLAPPPAEMMWSPWSTFCGRCRTPWRPGWCLGWCIGSTGSWIHKAWSLDVQRRIGLDWHVMTHDGSMVLLYMVLHGSHQYTPNHVSIYTSTMDPMGDLRIEEFEEVLFCCLEPLWEASRRETPLPSDLRHDKLSGREVDDKAVLREPQPKAKRGSAEIDRRGSGVRWVNWVSWSMAWNGMKELPVCERQLNYWLVEDFFPACQVRVVRFYHSVPAPPSSSPPPSPPPLPPLLTSTSALPTLRQSLRQLPRAVGTAGPQLPASDLSGHGWTSTARFWAQWAPLDLNLGPSELSGHRWTSAARWNARIYARKTARIYAR